MKSSLPLEGPLSSTTESGTWFTSTLGGRLTMLLAVFALELVLLSLSLNKDAIAARTGILGLIRNSGAEILRASVAFTAIFLPFLFVRNKATFEAVSSEIAALPFSKPSFAVHLTAMAVFAGLSSLVFGHAFSGWQAAALASLWFLAGLAGIVLGALAFVPGAAWQRFAFQSTSTWLFALLAIAYACLVGATSRLLWEPTRQLTFTAVHSALKPFLSDVFADSATRLMGTARFYVRLEPECSGLEGIGLILAFTCGWLVLFRKECRFPNALVLIPVGVLLMFLLNIARISALILIGDAGASHAALEGFHSQAGWILFNTVAVLFAAGATRVRWLRRDAIRASVANPVVPYLAPFTAILAASMLSEAVSGGFEWLYPVRFVAAALVLWQFRRRYTNLRAPMTWAGPAIGLLVFALWVGLDRWSGRLPHGAPAALASAPEASRYFWLTFRILAATVTVPIAEELAFRGFLLRRLVSDDFQSVPLQTPGWMAVILSSLVFGVLHPGHWMAGTVAGLCYAGAVMRRGSILDGIIAHGTTNALLAFSVVAFDNWQYW